jgi:hypothetical protein
MNNNSNKIDLLIDVFSTEKLATIQKIMNEYKSKTDNSIGGSNTDIFEVFVQDRIYVDKSLLIKEIIDLKDHIFISAPQRWGKSLNLSMLEAFFQPDGGNPGHYKDGKLEKLCYNFKTKNKNNVLFEGGEFKFEKGDELFTKQLKQLKIAAEVDKCGDKYLDYQGQSPVIYLNFRNVSDDREDVIKKKLERAIFEAYKKHE